MNDQEIVMTDNRITLVSLLSESCLELFEGYSIELKPNETLLDIEKSEIKLIALISLNDYNFRASLTLCISPTLLKKSFPISDETVTNDQLHDWLGELSNQLSGRFKNKLCLYGINAELGIPMLLQSSQLQIDLPKCSENSKHQFLSNQNEIVEINFSTILDKDLVLNEVQKSDVDILAEGEMLFF